MADYSEYPGGKNYEGRAYISCKNCDTLRADSAALRKTVQDLLFQRDAWNRKDALRAAEYAKKAASWDQDLDEAQQKILDLINELAALRAKPAPAPVIHNHYHYDSKPIPVQAPFYATWPINPNWNKNNLF